jgi:hypothetical protein
MRRIYIRVDGKIVADLYLEHWAATELFDVLEDLTRGKAWLDAGEVIRVTIEPPIPTQVEYRHLFDISQETWEMAEGAVVGVLVAAMTHITAKPADLTAAELSEAAALLEGSA